MISVALSGLESWWASVTQGGASLCPGLWSFALSGLDLGGGLLPRVSPWALACRPFRAKDRTSHLGYHQGWHLPRMRRRFL